MIVAYCLADFFNLDLWPTGREPTYRDVFDGIDLLTEAAITATNPIPDELNVRLYGGWHGEVPETRVHLREITEAVIRDYPGRTGRTRIRLGLADAPVWDPSARLLNSTRVVRMRGGPYQFESPLLCAHKGSCTVLAVKSWSRGRCPESDCTVRVADIGWRYRQKMVDTLLAVDAITIDREGLADAVLIASDDDDMVPVLLAVGERDIQTVHMRRQQPRTDYYGVLLSERGIQTHNW